MELNLNELEKLIRAGQFDKVDRALKALPIRKIPRAQALPVANMARRVNQYIFALKILNPIVRAEAHAHQEPATTEERIEYAESLRKLGAVEEARQILMSADPEKFPQTLLFQSFCYFSQWRYDMALPILRRYVKSAALPDYPRLVGQINLAAALVNQNQLDEAAQLLKELRAKTSEGGHTLLYGNSLELSAQLGLRNRDFAQVRAHLIQAEGQLKNASWGLLWTRKWAAITDSLEAGRVKPELLRMRDESRAGGHWETYRDCSFHIGAISRDRDLLAQVYFGTPFLGYRENMMKQVGEWFSPPEIFLTGPQNPARVLDVETGTLESGEEVLPLGQAHHRMLILIAGDSFRPVPLVAAFAQLFPEEYFNALSSPARVHQAVKRLRKSILNHGLGLRIQEKNGSYSLEAPGDVALKIRLRPVPASNSRDLHLGLILRECGGQEFSVSEVARILGASTSTSQRLLRWGVREEKLKVSGHGPRTRYQAA